MTQHQRIHKQGLMTAVNSTICKTLRQTMPIAARVTAYTLASTLFAQSGPTPVSFEIIVIPDSQAYTVAQCENGAGHPAGSFLDHYIEQMRWIQNWSQSENVQFVTHIGDIVENGLNADTCSSINNATNPPFPLQAGLVRLCNQTPLGCPAGFADPSTAPVAPDWTQWDKAKLALNELQFAGVKYSFSFGNHDFDCGSAQCALPVRATSGFMRDYSPQQFQAMHPTWFISYHSGIPDGTSSVQIFDDGNGFEFLHLNLELRPRDEAIEWAQAQLTLHSHLPTVVSTHQHLQPDTGERSTDGESAWQQFFSFDLPGCTLNLCDPATNWENSSNSGEGLYQKLLIPFPQIFLLACGHATVTSKRTSTSILDYTVLEFMTDFQYLCEGGFGWFRRVRIDEHDGTLEVSTQRPHQPLGATTADSYHMDALTCDACTSTPDYGLSSNQDHNFKLLTDISALRSDLESTTIYRLRGPSVTFDRIIDSQNSDPSGNLDTLIAANPNSQACIKFDLGAAMPSMVKIDKAILTVTYEASEGYCTPTINYAQSINPGSWHILRTSAWTDLAQDWFTMGSGINASSEFDRAAIAKTMSPIEGLPTPGIVKGTLSYDVTEAVKHWHKFPATNHGVVLMQGNADDLRIRSSEWAFAPEQPMLTIVTRTN